ncbi:hypothetical protein DEE93_17250 [Ralstonia pickettii]|uniref:DUF6471 domain-containing protein n=1 Tax=Ralstonia pickettii TaxID=329 RepID=A0AAW4Q8P4_RALPI|nr:hypothetical protein [Ralstonia pickettii]MBA9851811.1 hypothetical protein [Ralstonia pickettii]MBA9919833.1 hypothetical protein [Ralstonia pickettii]MBA9958764.1 hypothetical protein [Ralstonia pickettii]MBA9965844.1 hypothetical protein [Ralstonia pickettii]
MALKGTDEVHAKHILLRELSARNLDIDVFAKKLATVGGRLPRESLEEQLTAGSFQFVLFLQLASVDRISGFERFVDDCDLVEASLRSQSSGG